jgi:hypothetical protein
MSVQANALRNARRTDSSRDEDRYSRAAEQGVAPDGAGRPGSSQFQVTRARPAGELCRSALKARAAQLLVRPHEKRPQFLGGVNGSPKT